MSRATRGFARLAIICAAIHFATAFVSGVISQGIDFDQLRNRSVASRMATPVHDLLMAPHGAVIRAMPNRWLTQGVVPIIPMWLIVHSLIWGSATAAFIIWRRSRAGNSG
jgi:hypothetical protein